MRATVVRAIRPLATQRTFRTAARIMTSGDTGSGFSRQGGEKAGDSFTRREKANEDMYIKEQERVKLRELREKLAVQKKHITDLEDHIETLMKDSGGEQH